MLVKMSPNILQSAGWRRRLLRRFKARVWCSQITRNSMWGKLTFVLDSYYFGPAHSHFPCSNAPIIARWPHQGSWGLPGLRHGKRVRRWKGIGTLQCRGYRFLQASCRLQRKCRPSLTNNPDNIVTSTPGKATLLNTTTFAPDNVVKLDVRVNRAWLTMESHPETPHRSSWKNP